MNVIQGGFPKTGNFTILASCDSIYLRKHGLAFVSSCSLANDVHIHIINPTKDDIDYATSLQAMILLWKKKNINGNTPFGLTVTWEESHLSNLSDEERRAYYACNRFLVAPTIMRQSKGSLLITDIDCLINRRIFKPAEDVGLFLRESLPGTVGWEARGTRVAAGAVFYNDTDSALIFADKVEDRICEQDFKWFSDQVSISEVYEEEKNNCSYHYYDSTFLDWEFISHTYIWTGKGERKHNNLKYLQRKAYYEGLIQ